MRQIPFGYMIKNGERAVNEREADVVKRIFTMYASGGSYNSIVETLRRGNVPYDETVESWNKNNVARILAHGKRYTGNEKWPKLLDEKAAQRSAATHIAKIGKAGIKKNAEQDALWPLLRCPECGGRLLRASGRAAKSGKLILRCYDCKYIVRTTRDELLANLQVRLEADDVQAIQLPELSPAILRGQNELMRASAANLPMNEFKKKLFALIVAQYEAIDRPRVPITYKEESNQQNRSSEIDWPIFGRAVSAVYVASSGEIWIQHTE